MPSASTLRLFAVSVVLGLAAGACDASIDQAPPAQRVATSPSSITAVREAAVDATKLPIELQLPSPLPSYLPVETVDLIDLSSGLATRLSGLSRSTRFAGTFGVTLLSPDRRKLARLSGSSEIEVVDISSGGVRRFTLPADPPPLGQRLSWAPDSLRLAATTYTSIFVLNTSTGTMSQAALTTQPQVGIGDVAWSPDGNWIAYGDGFFLSRVRPDGTAPATGPKYYGGPRRIAWSPTSASFAFDALDLDMPATPYPAGRIFLSDPDLNARPVTPGGLRASWSPSGDAFTFLYSANPGQSLMAADADGSNHRTLATLPLTTVSIDDRIDWSPDGQWVAVSADGAVQLVSPMTGEVLAAIRPPPPVKLDHDTYTRCRVTVLGWTSRSEIMTLMTCENSM